MFLCNILEWDLLTSCYLLRFNEKETKPSSLVPRLSSMGMRLGSNVIMTSGSLVVNTGGDELN